MPLQRGAHFAGSIAFYGPLVAEMAAWIEAGATLEEVASRLNEDGRVHRRGGRWNSSNVYTTLRRFTEPEGFARLEAVWKARRGPLNARRRDFYGPLVAEVVTWIEAGSTLSEAAARLNSEGKFNALGRPWYTSLLARVCRRTLGTEGYARLASLGRCRGGPLRRSRRRQIDDCLPRILEMLRGGYSLRETARSLPIQDEGPRWTEWKVKWAVTRHLGREGYQALMARSRNQARHRAREESSVERRRIPGSGPVILGPDKSCPPIVRGKVKPPLASKAAFKLVHALLEAGPEGLKLPEIARLCGDARGILRRLARDPDWAAVIHRAKGGRGYRIWSD